MYEILPLRSMKYILSIIFFTISFNLSFGQSWIDESENLYNNGFHKESIDLINDNVDRSNLTNLQKSKSYQILADNYITIGNTEKFKDYSTISFNILEDKTSVDSCLYYSNLGEYNHYKLRSDDL